MELQFNELPKAITDLQNTVNEIKGLLLQNSTESPNKGDHWFDLNELVEYDPEKRTKPTFYGYIHQRAIPFHKRGKKLIFLKSEIDNWLKSGRKKTIGEIALEANSYIKIKGGNKP